MAKRQRPCSIKFEQSADDLCLPFLFDLPEDRLVIVDGSDIDVIEKLQSALKYAMMIGIDTETEPRTSPTMPFQKTSLLQLAVRSLTGVEQVFIIDLIRIYNHSNLVEMMDILIGECWRNKAILKIAHAMKGDAKELCVSYPEASAYNCLNGLIEVTSLHRLINPHMEREVSLKYMTKHYLHGENFIYCNSLLIVTK